MSEKLAYDESGKNIKSWKIGYCGWLTKNMLLSPEKPWQYAYIVAETAAEAVRKLKEELRLVKVKLAGPPVLELIPVEEYENS